MATATFDPNSDDPGDGMTSHAPSAGSDAAAMPLDSFHYDDGITRLFVAATVVWGAVATLMGLVASLLLVLPELFYPLTFAEHLSFGRLRPLHTNMALLAFVGNGLFAAVYYSTQRLCKTPMWSGALSQLHFWSWQAIIVATIVTLPLGMTQGKEFAELEWPIDLAIAVAWVAFFGVNFFMTLARRRERHMYVSLWFYIATIVTITIVHIFGNLVAPAGWGESYSVFAGVHDAFVQGWYGHNLLAFLLIMPFLGLMYYFLPKAANRPIYSYKLAVIHFWAMLFLYVMSSPNQLHYTAIPEWASTFGMIFGLMLWMPAWGGMINGLWTVRGADSVAAAGPVLRFFTVGLAFYGIYTLESAVLSIKSVYAMAQYSDWMIAHVHLGTLGWSGLLAFGMLYWLLPRLFQTSLWSPRMAGWHFWIAIAGTLLYVLPIYAAGVTESAMWMELNSTGRMAYPQFIKSVEAVTPMWWLRVFGGALYILGVAMLGVNYVMTWASRPSSYQVPVVTARRLSKNYHEDGTVVPTDLEDAPMLDLGRNAVAMSNLRWHRVWERQPLRFTLMVTGVVVIASLIQFVPMFLIRSNVPMISGVQPYTPLELAGREIFVSEGCVHCHSQMVRPLVPETQRYGAFSQPGESVYDRPAQWGSRRIGPDLARVGGKLTDTWHWLHLEDPRQEQIAPESVMPSFIHLLDRPIDFEKIHERVATAHRMGVPYDRELTEAAEMARDQAEQVAADIVSQGGPFQRALPGGERILVMDTQAVALIAYLQRLGTDLTRPAPAAEGEAGAGEAGAGEAAVEPAAGGGTVTDLPGATAGEESGGGTADTATSPES